MIYFGLKSLRFIKMELIQPLAENSIIDLHNFCAENNHHISIITPQFVLLHKSYEDWI